MPAEHRFVLADFTVPGPSGRPRLYEAGKHYPMPSAIAHAATKYDLVAKAKPVHWAPPNFWARPATLTVIDIAEAEAELLALDWHAAEMLEPVVSHSRRQ